MKTTSGLIKVGNFSKRSEKKRTIRECRVNVDLELLQLEEALAKVCALKPLIGQTLARYMSGVRTVTLAEELGMTPIGVRKRLQKGRILLQDILTDDVKLKDAIRNQYE
jgi:hypothetical protein